MYVNVRTADALFAYPLSVDSEYEFEGRKGAFGIRCEKGTVRVVRSFCSEGICRHKILKASGDSVICLPNMITVWLSSDAFASDETVFDANGIDDISY